ncbi:MAG TPA: Ig-like domain-containing protein [Gemmatimonadaceae bacterium]|nr:Ig-like domain-containing protein [Gemmatimonadaceae bacterium]
MAAFVLAAAFAPPARAQQVIKPASGAQGQPRLPAPQLRIEQTPGGCVRLSWEPVEGAKTYFLGRSLGTGGYQRVLDAPEGAFTSYLDRGTKAGVRVSYIVTPVDFNGLAGFRAVSENFIPTASPSGDCMTAAGPRAATDAAGPAVVASMAGPDILVRWTAVANTEYYEVQHLLNDRVAGFTRVGTNHEFTLRAPAAGEHQFLIVAKRFIVGPLSRPSNRVVVQPPGASSPADSSGGGTGGTPSVGSSTIAPVAPSEVSLTVGAPVALRVGATAQLSAPAGSRWSSLDAAVATTDGAGVVSAIAPGRARIVAISAQPDGAMRITVIHVVVSP